MASSGYKPVAHDHKKFLTKARRKPGFTEAYEERGFEYALMDELLSARTKANLTQNAVASRMGTTKSAVSRLESAAKHAPSLTTLRKYAHAVGCELHVSLVPQRTRRTRS